MAKKKKLVEEEIAENYDPNQDFMSLLEGTGFSVVNEARILCNNRKIPTPLEIVNCLIGGGIPFGVVLNSFGRSKTGKSTWLYQMMAEFQKKYPEGICFVIDTETSGDSSRLRHFGIDVDKVMIICPPSIESGFLAIMKMLDNKSKNPNLKDKPVFGLWDSLSNGLAQDNSTQSRMNAQDRARVIKNYMGPLMAEIEKHEFFLGVINQVVRQTDMYGNSKDVSGGGVGLEHQVHMQTMFTRTNSDTYDGDYLVKRVSMMKIDKSKFSPEFWNIPVVMDITEGGMIDKVESLVYYITSGNSAFVPNKTGWYKFDDMIKSSEMKFYIRTLYDYNKSYRYNDFLDLVKNNRLIYDILKIAFMERMSDIYHLQSGIIKPYLESTIDEVYSLAEYPELKIDRDNDYANNILDNIKNNSELANTIINTINDPAGYTAVCMSCGKGYYSLWGCETDNCSSAVISVGKARLLLKDLMQVDEPSINTNINNESDLSESDNEEG